MVGNGFFKAVSYWWIEDRPLQDFLGASLLCEWETEFPGSFLQKSLETRQFSGSLC